MILGHHAGEELVAAALIGGLGGISAAVLVMRCRIRTAASSIGSCFTRAAGSVVALLPSRSTQVER